MQVLQPSKCVMHPPPHTSVGLGVGLIVGLGVGEAPVGALVGALVSSSFAHQSFFSCDQHLGHRQSYFSHLAGRDVAAQAVGPERGIFVQPTNLP